MSGMLRLDERLSADVEQLSLIVEFGGVRLGRLRVGEKSGKALFTQDDLDLLQTIVNQGALALAHAYAYRELEARRREQAAGLARTNARRWSRRSPRRSRTKSGTRSISSAVSSPTPLARSIRKTWTSAAKKSSAWSVWYRGYAAWQATR